MNMAAPLLFGLIYLGVIVYVLVMLGRLTRAVESIADEIGRRDRL